MTTTSNLSPTRLKRDELKALAEVTATPCVSMLMPTDRSGPETQQGAVRFKNLLEQTKGELEHAGHDCSILAPIDSLSTNATFWQHQSEGLAIFLTSDDCRLIKLDRSVKEHVCVADSFFLLPLICQHTSSEGHLVLSLTWDSASLSRFDGQSIELVETETLPAKFHDLVLPRDPEVSLQNTSHRSVGNTATSSTAMFHGHGEGEDKIEADRDQYLSLVGDQVSAALHRTGLPWVIVATSEVAGHFQATTNLVADVNVVGSPSQWSDEQLRERVRQAVAQQQNTGRADDIDRFSTARAQAKGSAEFSEILQAAKTGRVQSLLVCNSEMDSNQVNTIVVETLRHGGEVHCSDAEQMPEQAPIAAIFRY